MGQGAAMLQEIADQFSLSEMRDRFGVKARLKRARPQQKTASLKPVQSGEVELF